MDTTAAPQIIEHINKSINFTPYDTRWIPFSAKFVGMGIHANAKGALNVYQLNNGDLDLISENKTANGIKCGTFGATSVEQRHIATGDHAGKLIVYDLEQPDKPVFTQQAHISIINAIDGCGGMDIGYGAPEIVTGGRDGCVRLWDTRVKDPVLALEPEEGQPARDCWTVAFGNSYSDEERCIAAGYDNGDVKIFDLRANTMRYETNVSNGVTSIEFDRKDIEMNKMVVSIIISICFMLILFDSFLFLLFFSLKGDHIRKQIPNIRHANPTPHRGLRLSHRKSPQSHGLVCSSLTTESRPVYDRRRQRRIQSLQISLSEEPNHHGQGQCANGGHGQCGVVE
jgi:WD40 repeat protein